MRDVAPAAKGAWLFGPGADLLLGCGLLYALIILPVSWGGDALLAARPEWLMPIAVVLLSAPHYGATLLRVYERREDRHAYTLFALYATLLLAAAFVAGLRSPRWSAFLLTLYLTWSPWHYTGQNYGIAVMFVRRAGLPLQVALKRTLYASFAVSYALTFLAMHAGEGTAWDPRGSGGRVEFLSLGIPHEVAGPIVTLLLGVNALLVVASAAWLIRLGSLRKVAPALALMFTQALWFTIPLGLGYVGVSTGLVALDRQQELYDYLLLVALAHATQYLWVTSFYARRGAQQNGVARFYAKAAIAGIALWTLPVVIFAPQRTGGMGYDGGLALLLASVINLHHFILDGAIWKLRSSRVASILIRSTPAAGAAGPEPVTWRRRAVWATAAAGLACWAYIFANLQFGLPAADSRGDLAARERILERVEALGHDNAALRLDLARRQARAGEFERAVHSYEFANSLQPSWNGYRDLARLYERHGDLAAARQTYAVAETSVGATRELLLSRALLAYKQGEYDAAHADAERALQQNPRDADILLILSEIAGQRGDADAALSRAREAWQLRPELLRAASRLAWVLATTPEPGQRDPDEALRVIEAVVKDTESVGPDTLDVLAACHAAVGRFEDATRLARRAAEGAEASGASAYAQEIRARLGLYESGQAYVEARRNANASRSA